MIETPMIQLTTNAVGQIINVIGIGIILAYGVAQYLMRSANDSDEERLWRQRSVGLMAGFAFYAVLIASFGPDSSWLSTVGQTIQTNVEQFSTEMATLGTQSEADDPLGRVHEGIQIIGLVAYIFSVGVLAVSGGAAQQVAGYARNLLP